MNAPEIDEGQLLREHLFEGDLLQLPAPEDATGFMPEWWSGELPALVYPPLAERGFQPGENVDLQVSHYNIYYGALRELAETADVDRGDLLRRLALEWNPQAALEVCELARQQIEVDVESAVHHYELALELDDNLYEAAQDAGMCHYAASNLDPEEREDRLDEAEELFRRAIELRPTAGLSWWSLARVLNDRGDAAGTEAVLHQFLAEQPEGTERDLIENALVHGFQEDSASDEQVRFQQAQAMAFGGQPAEAVEMLRPLAEAHPDVVEIWFVLGAACRRAGDSAEAERCLRRAARLAPGEPFVWWELARAYMEMSQWKPAEDALRKALEADPENAQYLADLGRVLLKQGDREGAREAVDRARELVPDDPEVVAAVEELARA